MRQTERVHAFKDMIYLLMSGEVLVILFQLLLCLLLLSLAFQSPPPPPDGTVIVDPAAGIVLEVCLVTSHLPMYFHVLPNHY